MQRHVPPPRLDDLVASHPMRLRVRNRVLVEARRRDEPALPGTSRLHRVSKLILELLDILPSLKGEDSYGGQLGTN